MLVRCDGVSELWTDSEEEGVILLKHAITPSCGERMVDLADDQLASCPVRRTW